MDNRPKSREKRVTNNGKGVGRRGSGQGTGPVGGGRPSSGGGRASGGGSKSPIMIILALVVALLGGGGSLAGGLLGGDSGSSSGYSSGTSTSGGSGYSGSTSSGSSSSGSSGYSGSGSSGYSGYSGGSSSGWGTSTNVGDLDTTVAKGARDKYTTIKGNGKDTTTIMVYMCGTDLEQNGGMATSDLKEMLAASFDDHINLIVYTGGCAGWRNQTISSKTNQIYQIKDGKLYRLESDMGSKAMTKPSTLTEFIKYCKTNFKADRNDLILWDHGGGSVSGYGYDQNFSRSGSMTLAGIQTALSDAGMKFDFIGFDACLMATTENALMLAEYADYLVASEETEPGVGWYYTEWLNAYGKDPSLSTLEIGKTIVDSFVTECNRTCRGQQTTLSVVDLAEVSATVPSALSAFAQSTSEMIKNSEYQTIATARAGSKEFAQSTKIDQVDLVHLATNMGTKEGKALANALLGAVKYNRTSTNVTNAYGLSIYFPNRKLSTVDNAVNNLEAIGMDDEYIRCIQDYASLEVAGQTVATSNGNAGNALPSLLGSLLTTQSTSSSSSSGSYGMDADAMTQLLGTLLSAGTSGNSGAVSGITGLEDIAMSFLSGRSLSAEEMSGYVSENQFDPTVLTWEKNSAGQNVISISEDQWSLITDLEMNMFYDDGEGYIDLGMDNLFDFDEDGKLIGDTDKTWISINGQPIAYYYNGTDTDGDLYTITGYAPAMLNGERVNLMLTFDQDNPYGYIAGAQIVYKDAETDTQAKNMLQLEVGDTLEFLCDYYSYDGDYQDSYYLGEPLEVTENMEISNTAVGDGDVRVCYRFTDIYGQQYWSLPVE